jgi:hypothetical protein
MFLRSLFSKEGYFCNMWTSGPVERHRTASQRFLLTSVRSPKLELIFQP